MKILSIIVPTYNESSNVPILIGRLREVFSSSPNSYEVIFVDDDSPDNTISVVKEFASSYSNIKYISRIHRRGLSSAVVEGLVFSELPYAIVIDGDLQHDLSKIPMLLERLMSGADMVLCGRDFSLDIGLSASRKHLSQAGNWLLNISLPAKIKDPLTGYFGVRKDHFNKIVRKLNPAGFKILYEIMTVSPGARIEEVTAPFFPRVYGESKLSLNIFIDTLDLFLNKFFNGYISVNFIFFAVIGLLGSFFHLAILYVLFMFLKINFIISQLYATFITMVLNYFNNSIITFRNIHIPISWTNLLKFMMACSIGTVINLLISSELFNKGVVWWLSATLGVIVGSVWNFSISKNLIWIKKI